MNTGGPAFPHGPLGDSIQYEDGRISHQWQGSPGMDLLDWFAGQALVGFLVYPYGSLCAQGIEKAAYDYAEAMLAERSRREAVIKESSTTDHSPDTGKMIPDPFAEDALRQLASDVLPADIKDAANEERLTWCAEQVRAQVNTLEAQNRELLERIKRLEQAGDEMFKWSERVGQEYWMKAKEAKP